jgi:SAM-dependent methyltransferase
MNGTTLPAPPAIAEHYERVMRETEGEYIYRRWGASEVQRRHYRQTERALAHALGERGEPGDVLEIGCGPAVWTPLYLPAARRVLLYDLSEAMLIKARERVRELDGGAHAHKVRYRCGDFGRDPVQGERFDTIVSLRAFEYMAQKAAFVKRCASLLRPRGVLLVVTKNRGWMDLRGAQQAAADGAPVELAMQSDLCGWREAERMFRAEGLKEVESRPVVFGSYQRPLHWRPVLAAADLLQRWRHRRPMRSAFDFYVESYVVTGRAGRNGA